MARASKSWIGLLIMGTVCTGAAIADDARRVFPGWGRHVEAVGSLAVADFNADGILDVALANEGLSTISLLYGRPDGSLGEPHAFYMGFASRVCIAAGDLVPDPSGLIDLVAVAGSEVRVLRNLGPPDYGLTLDAVYSGSGYAEDVAVGDFDGDTRLDIAYGNYPGLCLRYGLPGGGLSDPPLVVDVEGFQLSASAKTAADLNADGRSDVVVGAYQSPPVRHVLLVMYGVPDQSVGFQAGPFLPAEWYNVSPVIADFDRDGWLDIASADTTARVCVYYADAEGGFGPAHLIDVPTEAESLAAGDVDGDGRPDIAVRSMYYPGHVPPPNDGVVLYSRGAGGFSEPVPFQSQVSTGMAMAAADLDRDGRAELVVTSNCYSIAVLRSRPRGLIATTLNFWLPGGHHSGLAAADFNQDGAVDLAVANNQANDVAVLWGQGDGTFVQEGDDLPVGNAPFNLVAGYFDDDDVLDLAVANYSSNSLTVWHGFGPHGGTFGNREDFALPGQPRGLVAGYFDSDNRMDVAGIVSGNVVVLRGLPGGSLDGDNPEQYSIGSSAGALVAADLNGDGRADLATISAQVAGHYPVSILYGQPDGTFAGLEQYPLPQIWYAHLERIAAGDLNSDGLLDIVVSWACCDPNYCWFEGAITVLYGQPGGGFGNPTSVEVLDSLGQLAIDDFDRDGRPDVAAAGLRAQHVFFGQPDGSLTDEEFADVGDFWTWPNLREPLVVADFNRDGRPDIANITYYGFDVTPVNIMLNVSNAKIPGELAVTSVTAPSSGTTAEVVTVAWTVQNQLPTPITGKWTDAVYLSRDQQWDINDIRLGTFDFLGTLAGYGSSGDAYSQALDVTLPGVFEGDWYILVRTDATDAVAEENGEIDNVMARPIAIQLPELPVCAPDEPCPGLDDVFTAPRRAIYYKLQAAADEDLLLTLDAVSEEGRNELYIRYGAPPTRSVSDVRNAGLLGPDQTLRVPGTQAGTYYVLAYADKLPADGQAPFNIKAQYLPLEISTLTPERGGNTGNVTVVITGSGFESGAQAKLMYLGADGLPQELEARRRSLADMGQMSATFDLRGVAPVVCDVRVFLPGGAVTTKAGAFTVEPGCDMALGLAIVNVTPWRRGAVSRFQVEVTNTSNIDAEFALVTIWPPEDPQVTLEIDAPEGPCCQKAVPRIPFIQVVPSASDVINVSARFGEDYPGPAPQFTVELRHVPPIEIVAAFPEMIILLREELLAAPETPLEVRQLASDPDTWEDFVWTALRNSGVFDPDLLPPAGGWRSSGPPVDWACLGCRAARALGCNILVGILCDEFAWWAGPLCEELLGRLCDGITIPICDPYCDDGDDKQNCICDIYLTINEEGNLVICHCPPEPQSRDPNLKLAPIGFGDNAFLMADRGIRYTILFENLESATAAGIQVQVTDQLRPQLDWATVALDEIDFGGTVIKVPPGLSHYQGRVEMDGWTWNETDGWHRYDADGQPVMPLVVDVEAGIDIDTGIVHWSIVCADPNTGYFPEDAYAGFLPPNQEAIFYPDPNSPDPNNPVMIHPGDGYLTYSVRPVADLPTGTQITNQATIVFDWCAPMDTPQVLNTIDAVGPTSAVSALPPETHDAHFDVCWSGEDDPGGSGVFVYTVYVSDNGGAYGQWLVTEDACATFTDTRLNHTYRFYSTAQDHVGHVEAAPTDPNGAIVPDAVTMVVGMRGDMNCDGAVDFGDINPFVLQLSNFAAWQATYVGCNPLNGDINDDGIYGEGSFGDINPFVALLTGGPPPVRGDLNCDGTVNFGDINPFVLQLSNFAAWQATYVGCNPLNGDINDDGIYGQGSFGDINPFVALLTGGG